MVAGGPRSGARHWLLSVGVSRYPFFPPLTYAERDALALADFWAQEPTLGAECCLLLSDRSAPRLERPTYPNAENIRTWLIHLCEHRVQPGDLLWCFFSGYGLCYDGQDYLMPVESSADRVSGTGIPMREVFQALRAAQKKVNRESTLLLLDFNRAWDPRTRLESGMETRNLARESGIATILSCQPGQVSGESERLQQGIFAAALLKSLREPRGNNLYALERSLGEFMADFCHREGLPLQQPSVVVRPPDRVYQILLRHPPTRPQPEPLEPAMRPMPAGARSGIPALLQPPGDRESDGSSDRESGGSDESGDRESDGLDESSDRESDGSSDRESGGPDESGDRRPGDRGNESGSASASPALGGDRANGPSPEAEMPSLEGAGDNGSAENRHNEHQQDESWQEENWEIENRQPEHRQHENQPHENRQNGALEDRVSENRVSEDTLAEVAASETGPSETEPSATGPSATASAEATLSEDRGSEAAVPAASAPAGRQSDDVPVATDRRDRPGASRLDRTFSRVGALGGDGPSCETSGDDASSGEDSSGDELAANPRRSPEVPASPSPTQDFDSAEASATAIDAFPDLEFPNPFVEDPDGPPPPPPLSSDAPSQNWIAPMTSKTPASPPSQPSNEPTTERGFVLKLLGMAALAMIVLLVAVYFRNRAEIAGASGTASQPATPALPEPDPSLPPLEPSAGLEAAARAFELGRYDEALTELGRIPVDRQPPEAIALRQQVIEARNGTLLGQARATIESSQASDFSRAIAEASKIQPGQPFYEQAQANIDRWSQVILDLAQGRADRGDFAGAIGAARLVPQEQPELRAQADALIAQWETLNQQKQANRDILNQAEAAIEPGQASSYNNAIALASQIPPGEPEYGNARAAIEAWSQEIYRLAEQRANAGQLSSAIQTASLVPEDTAAHRTAEQAIIIWQRRMGG